ncbi:MAG: hypothetical protein ABSH47_10940 [Bryobacteraceae bacterium]|jgi:hypothetical protein
MTLDVIERPTLLCHPAVKGIASFDLFLRQRGYIRGNRFLQGENCSLDCRSDIGHSFAQGPKPSNQHLSRPAVFPYTSTAATTRTRSDTKDAGKNWVRWESGNPKPGFPLSHRTDGLRRKEGK